MKVWVVHGTFEIAVSKEIARTRKQAIEAAMNRLREIRLSDLVNETGEFEISYGVPWASKVTSEEY